MIFGMWSVSGSCSLPFLLSPQLSHYSNNIISIGLLCHLIESYQGLLCLTGKLLLLSQTTAKIEEWVCSVGP